MADRRIHRREAEAEAGIHPAEAVGNHRVAAAESFQTETAAGNFREVVAVALSLTPSRWGN
jgi:hypothetical protein